MNKLVKRFSVLGLFLLFLSAWPITSFAEDTKDGQLLYDLKYDEGKSVLSGKSQPNANIFINDLAGSIVADDEGNFEIPVPKGLKVSTILMLDAVGEASTDVRFNFEKNTIETEETTTASSASDSSSTSSSSDSAQKESEKEAEKSSDSETSESASDSSTKETASTDTSKESVTGITSDSYNADEEEPEKSLVWLWTLLIILGVIGVAVTGYLWYKKKIEAEEKNKKPKHRKKSSSGKSKKQAKGALDDDFEDDLYESLTSTVEEKIVDKTSKGKTKKKTEIKTDEKIDLDALIDSELEKNSTKKRRKKSSSKNKKKKSKK